MKATPSPVGRGGAAALTLPVVDSRAPAAAPTGPIDNGGLLLGAPATARGRAREDSTADAALIGLFARAATASGAWLRNTGASLDACVAVAVIIVVVVAVATCWWLAVLSGSAYSATAESPA